MKKLILCLLACFLQACVALPPLPSQGTSSVRKPSSGPISISSFGGKGGYVVPGMTVLPSDPPCNKEAYIVGFRNAYAMEWNDAVTYSKVRKKSYIDTSNLRSGAAFSDPFKDNACSSSSLIAGEADGKERARADFARQSK